MSTNIDLSLRDHDGATAAFRAQVNGHSDVTAYLQSLGCSGEIPGLADGTHQSPVYSQPNKAKKTANLSTDRPARSPEYVEVDFTKVTSQSSTPKVMRQQSSAAERLNYLLDEMPSGPIARSQTLPHRLRAGGVGSNRGDVRRLIRQELEAAFSSPYEEPVKQSTNSAPQSFCSFSAGPSLQELQGMMRQEIEKYKSDINPTAAATSDHTYSALEEDPYSTLEELGIAPRPPAPAPATKGDPSKVPLLPPRNQHMMLAALSGNTSVETNEQNDGQTDDRTKLTLKGRPSGNTALRFVEASISFNKTFLPQSDPIFLISYSLGCCKQTCSHFDSAQ